ncbi:hypothetical protein FS842_006814 [Serendipita sp. 407]|nr:hypothetical protein FS842_006814 [Serendipita sp. 407]
MLSTPQTTRRQLGKCIRELPLHRSFSSSSACRLIKPQRGQSDPYRGVLEDGKKYLEAKKILKPELALVLLEDILERHQNKLADLNMPRSDVGRLCMLCWDYAKGLDLADRPLAAISFTRNWIAVIRKRVEANERHAEARLISALFMLYNLTNMHGEDPKEKWRAIHEARTIIERLTPEDWFEELSWSLRDANAIILQYWSKERDMALADPRTRKLGLGSLISAYERVVQLEQKSQSKGKLIDTRVEALCTLCYLKQEQGPDEDFRVYALKLHEATRQQFAEATTKTPIGVHTLHVLHGRCLSFVLLCRAQVRAKKWNEAIKIAKEGIDTASMIQKTFRFGMSVQLCQLGIILSECHLRTEQYAEALEHAKVAVSLAQQIPEVGDVLLENLGEKANKRIWVNRAALNFCDTVYNSNVIAPEEEFGLKAARAGEKRNKQDSDIQFELEFAERALKALHKAGRHHEALDACRSLLDRLVNHLPDSGSRYPLVLDQIDDICEYAAECFEKLEMAALADELRDNADEFNAFTHQQEEQEDQPLSEFADRADDLRDAFVAIYKRGQESHPELPLPSADSSSGLFSLWKGLKGN